MKMKNHSIILSTFFSFAFFTNRIGILFIFKDKTKCIYFLANPFLNYHRKPLTEEPTLE